MEISSHEYENLVSQRDDALGRLAKLEEATRARLAAAQGELDEANKLIALCGGLPKMREHAKGVRRKKAQELKEMAEKMLSETDA